jgi:hypothetical protein
VSSIIPGVLNQPKDRSEPDASGADHRHSAEQGRIALGDPTWTGEHQTERHDHDGQNQHQVTDFIG